VKKTILSLLIVLFASSAFAASFASDEQALRKLDREQAIATYMTDAEWFRLHLSDDYVRITSSGALQTKQELIESMKHSKVEWEPYETSDVRIQAHGSTAIVSGRIVQKYTDGHERTVAELRYSDVWIRSSEGWFNVSSTISPIAIKHERKK
jgi:hypothetical protein